MGVFPGLEVHLSVCPAIQLPGLESLSARLPEPRGGSQKARLPAPLGPCLRAHGAAASRGARLGTLSGSLPQPSPRPPAATSGSPQPLLG